MSNYLECTPAYGRDYKTAKDVKTAWAEGKDWTVQDWGNKYDGMPINNHAANTLGITVMLRYKRNTQVVVIPPAKR